MAQVQITGLPVASSVGDADAVVLSQGGVMKQAAAQKLRETQLAKTVEFNAQFPVYNPANGTAVLIDLNRVVGDILGADWRMVAGSCTATLQIADDDGGNATNITGLAGLAITTTRRSDTATAARTMLITGAADRQLLLVLASVVGAGPLLIGLRYQRSP
jgi:hypothetical protein